MGLVSTPSSIFEEEPRPAPSPGEEFCKSINDEFERLVVSLVRANSSANEIRRRTMKFLTTKLDQAGIPPDSGIRRYVFAFHQWLDDGAKSRVLFNNEERKRGELTIRMKAEAVEIYGECATKYLELKRRISLCAWPPNLNSAGNVAPISVAKKSMAAVASQCSSLCAAIGRTRRTARARASASAFGSSPSGKATSTPEFCSATTRSKKKRTISRHHPPMARAERQSRTFDRVRISRY